MVKSCFLFGHRSAPERLRPMLEEAVEDCYARLSVREFIVGHYGGFDRMAAAAVKKAKQRHGDIALVMLLPYHPSLRPAELPEGFDATVYPEGMESVPPRLSILRANRRMVESCGAVICYAEHPGNARNLLEFARKQEKRGLAVRNLGEL